MRVLYKTTKWMLFYLIDRKPKTVVIEVKNKKGHVLGLISWYWPFRQYVFKPDSKGLVFNNGCLNDISDVLTQLNEGYKRKNAEQKE